VYSAAKNNPSLSLEWARYPDVGLPRPDICIFLKLSTEDASKRGGFGQEKYEKREMQDRVCDLFDDLILQRHPESSDTKVIDAGASLDEVESQVLQKVEKIVEEVSKGLYGNEVRRIEPWA
jgi:dTMP kinase